MPPWANTAIALFSPIATLIGFAWHRATNRGVSTERFNTMHENVKAHGIAINELSEASVAQKQINKYQEEWNHRKEAKVELILERQNQMQGREDGRQHRER